MTVDLIVPTRIAGIKLGSIAAHARELIEPGGHPLDAEAIRGLLEDPDVKGYLEVLDLASLLPVAR